MVLTFVSSAVLAIINRAFVRPQHPCSTSSTSIMSWGYCGYDEAVCGYGCMPKDAVCCGGEGYCDAGWSCAGDMCVTSNGRSAKHAVSKNAKIGIAVGCAVGGLVLIAIIVLVVRCVLRRRAARREAEYAQNVDPKQQQQNQYQYQQFQYNPAGFPQPPLPQQPYPQPNLQPHPQPQIHHPPHLQPHQQPPVAVTAYAV